MPLLQRLAAACYGPPISLRATMVAAASCSRSCLNQLQLRGRLGGACLRRMACLAATMGLDVRTPAPSRHSVKNVCCCLVTAGRHTAPQHSLHQQSLKPNRQPYGREGPADACSPSHSRQMHNLAGCNITADTLTCTR